MRSLITATLCLVVSAPAFAYTVRTTTSGKPLRWPSGTVAIEIALSNAPAGVDSGEAEAAAVAAFATYTDLMRDMAPAVGLAVSIVSDTPKDGNDGHNFVRWVTEDWAEYYDPGALAVTLTSYDSTSGRITDADVVVNAEKYKWSADGDLAHCHSAYDLQNVLTHEAGHVFGLGHEKNDLDATMYPSSGMCESKKRDLDSDDMAGLSDLYVSTTIPESGETGISSLGCSFSGRRPVGGTLAVLLVIGALLLGPRRPRAILALALLALAAAPAGATTVRRLSLDELSGDAVVVVRGVVGGVAARRIGGHIYTDATLAVSECLKGSCGATLTVRQLGGELDGLGVHVEGNAELTPATEVVLMLRRRLDGAFAPLGMAQGAFRVEREPVRGEIRGLSQAATALRFATSDGDGAVVAGSPEHVTLDEIRAAIARAKLRSR